MENSNVRPLVQKEKNIKDNSSFISSLSPREIVSDLDRYVVGQNKAIRAVVEGGLKQEVRGWLFLRGDAG